MRLEKERTLGILQVVRENRFFIIPFLIFFSLILAATGILGNDRLFLDVNHFHSSFADHFFVGITNMGNGLMAFILVLILLLVSYREALTFLSVTLLLTLIVDLLKRVLFPEFIRPALYFGSSSLHLVSGYHPPMLHTFPSGHAVTAFSACLFLSFLVRQKMVKFALFLVALMIGYSRIYVSAHFPFDVVFGSFLAVVVTTLVFYLSRKISNNWIDKRIRLGTRTAK